MLTVLTLWMSLGRASQRGWGGCSKGSVSPGPEIGPDGLATVDISGLETTGRGMAWRRLER